MNVASQIRAGIDEIRMDVGPGGLEQNIIEGQGYLERISEALRRKWPAANFVDVDPSDGRATVHDYGILAHDCTRSQ